MKYLNKKIKFAFLILPLALGIFAPVVSSESVSATTTGTSVIKLESDCVSSGGMWLDGTSAFPAYCRTGESKSDCTGSWVSKGAAGKSIEFCEPTLVMSRSITSETACSDVDGAWFSDGTYYGYCKHKTITTPEACVSPMRWVDGYSYTLNLPYGSERQTVPAFCEPVGNSNSVAAPGDSHTPTSCAILPDFICNAKENRASNGDVSGTAVWMILIFVLNIMVGAVAFVALAGVIYGAVLYSSAGGNPEKVRKAISTIRNVVVGFLLFVAMYGLLQWLVPGGVFN